MFPPCHTPPAWELCDSAIDLHPPPQDPLLVIQELRGDRHTQPPVSLDPAVCIQSAGLARASMPIKNYLTVTVRADPLARRCFEVPAAKAIRAVDRATRTHPDRSARLLDSVVCF